MSMNFSEFKNLLGADPLNSDPETQRARESGPEFEAAGQEAMAFEKKIQAAVAFPVDSEALVADILSFRDKPSRQVPRWLAIAAGLLMVVGITGYLWDGLVQPDTVEEFVAQHYHYDGEKLLAKAGDNVAAAEINEIMAAWDLQANPELLKRVTYIKTCFTMDGKGAHMIVQTDRGAVNLIIMPNTVVTDRKLVEFEDMQAHLIAFGGGSAAIIGNATQSVSSLDALIRASISSTI
jgi:hypothetical protein